MILDQIVPKFFFCFKRGFFGKTDIYLFSIYCAPLPYNVFKKYWLADDEVWDVEILDQIGHKSCTYLYRGSFLKNCYFCLLQILHQNTKMFKKITHTWKGGVHLSIYFWHLLMNLKNKLLKKLLKWNNKNKVSLIFTMFHF